MAVYNYTVGSGGDYATFRLALEKVSSDGPGGNTYNFDQISDLLDRGMTNYAYIYDNVVNFTCDYNSGKNYSDRYKITADGWDAVTLGTTAWVNGANNVDSIGNEAANLESSTITDSDVGEVL